jgi:hypothetical protein
MIHCGAIWSSGTRRKHPNDARNRKGNGQGACLIDRDTLQNSAQAGTGLTLLFPAGGRPSVENIERLLNSSDDRAEDTATAVRQMVPAQVSSRRGRAEGWLEVVASGLTFDVIGLNPGPALPIPAARHFFGLPRDAENFAFEAMAITPGPHLAGAGAMVPVVRIMAVFASALAAELGALAVCFAPAGSWMDVQYFSRIVAGWSAGGVFPALGLTGIERTLDGGVESDGLAYFIGQELRVEARPGEAAADTVKLAARMIDHLVNHGAIAQRDALLGPTGEALLAEPSADGTILRIWRDG